MLKCKEFSDFSSDYLDGNLSPYKRLNIWWHLVVCAHCRRYLEQLKLVIDLLKKTPPSPADTSDVDKIMERIRRGV